MIQPCQYHFPHLVARLTLFLHKCQISRFERWGTIQLEMAHYRTKCLWDDRPHVWVRLPHPVIPLARTGTES